MTKAAISKVDTHASAPPGQTVELTSVRGIGPATAAKLAAAGISTHAELAALLEEEVPCVAALAGISQGKLLKLAREAAAVGLSV